MNNATLKELLIEHAQGANRHTTYNALSSFAQAQNLNFRQLLEQEQYSSYFDPDVYVFLTSLNISIADNIYE